MTIYPPIPPVPAEARGGATLTIEPRLTDVFTEEESARLIELESTIREGEQAFIAVGLALAEISKRRLYRRTFKTFEAYIEQQWGWRRQHGYELIQASTVVDNVRSNVQSLPSLTHAVALAPLPASLQRAIAGRVDFSQTSVRDLRRIVKDAKCELGRRPAAVRSGAPTAVPPTLPADVHLHCADVRSISVYVQAADLILTSPPYGVGKNYGDWDDDAGSWADFMKEWETAA